jgi:hypothetical protein
VSIGRVGRHRASLDNIVQVSCTIVSQ